MNQGKYNRTVEIREKISNSLKGKHISQLTEFRKGIIPWNKGKHLSEKHKKKIGEGNKGKVVSKETREKLKNLSRRFQLEETKKKISKTLMGHNSWNKGKKGIYSLETLNKMSLSNRGKIRNENTKEKIRKARRNQVFPIKDSSIEVKIQGYLRKLDIEFFTHQYMNIKHGYQCDIFIPSLNLVIECDGNYWHKYPTRTEIDNIRTKELTEKGFKVLRLWESEIKVIELNDFKVKLHSVLINDN